ncbi:Glutamate receptor 4 [Stylophora pistillata]|uniref:Glutamate receptor 4 n=1 Tax=Stylophora pistillata TaxID=50429 RepID=A0A2B4SEQ4_STYPI|nr:Glutamate receptor 4 [Stylophora pistillata]
MSVREGFIGEDPEEFEAVLDTASNKISSLSNISLVLKKYNISKSSNLFGQAAAFLQHNVIVLIDGSDSHSRACALSTVTNIPLIRLHGNGGSFKQCDRAIQMSVGYKDYAHATFDLLNTFGWRSVVLVFKDESFLEAGYFRTLSRGSKLAVNLVKFSQPSENEDSGTALLRTMDEIRFYKAEVILLYVDKDNMESMLNQVPLNLTSHPSNIVLAVKLPYNQTPASEELENLLHIHGDTNKDLLAVSHDAVRVISRAVNNESCSSINGSAVHAEDREAILLCMKEVGINGLTGPVHFDAYGKRIGINLEILNLRSNCFKKVGTWNSAEKAVIFGNISQNLVTPPRAGSLEGRRFRIVVIKAAPFMMSRTEENGEVVYTGYCIDLLNELARNLKFTYEIYFTPDGFYGAETDNGTWNGIIGELLYKHADMAVADLTITEHRETVVDFTVPYMFYTEEMLLKKTLSNGKVDLLQFMNPFDSHVWFATLASLVIISFAVFFINYLSPYGYKDENGRGTAEEFSFSNSVWFALSCMLQQGADYSPRSLSEVINMKPFPITSIHYPANSKQQTGRILAGCYWFTILISVSTYTANLAAFFTVKNAESPINNLKDIVKSSYQVGVVQSSSTYEAFRRSKYDTYQTIWNRIKAADDVIKSYEQAAQLVREREEYVFIADGPGLRHVANQPPCDLTVVPGLTTAKGLSLALQANDPHTAYFTLAILHLHENNFLETLKRKWWDTENGCPEEQETALSRKRIGLLSMLGVYVVLGVGIVVAFLTLLVEIFWSKRSKQIVLSKETTRSRKWQRSKTNSIQVRPADD